MQTSLKKACTGIIKNIKADKNYSSLKYAIEKIYRSWFDETANAYRISNKIQDADTFPAIYIQPYVENVYSLVTRSSTSSELTNKANYTENIHNQVNVFDDICSELLKKIDEIILKPSKVYFYRDDNIKVCKVTNQVITESAYWTSMEYYLKEGLIDRLEYLMNLNSNMIAKSDGYKFSNSNQIFGKGLPASPGIAIGKLIFRTSNLSKVKYESKILIVDDSVPDDIEVLHTCTGAIGTIGGMVSHLAVVCRGMRMPAVTGCGVVIDEERKVAENRDFKLQEFSIVLVDGSNGKITFSNEEINIEHNYKYNSENKKHLDNTYEIIAYFTENIEFFKKLTLEQQLHIANLKNHFKKIGYVK